MADEVPPAWAVLDPLQNWKDHPPTQNDILDLMTQRANSRLQGWRGGPGMSDAYGNISQPPPLPPGSPLGDPAAGGGAPPSAVPGYSVLDPLQNWRNNPPAQNAQLDQMTQRANSRLQGWQGGPGMSDAYGNISQPPPLPGQPGATTGAAGGAAPGFGPDPIRTDPELWKKYRADASAASHGINRMPYVFGGERADLQETYPSLNTMPPSDIFNTFFPAGIQPQARAAADPNANKGAGFDPNTLALLGAFGFGGLGGLGGLFQTPANQAGGTPPK